MSAAAGVRTRRARPGDAPAIATVMRAAIRALAAPFHDPGEIVAWSSLPPLYHLWAMTAGGERYVVAERRGRICGYAAIRGAEVTAVFVRPAHARRGVGRVLLARLEREAAERGLRALRVLAARSAAGFYARMGYRAGRRIRVPLPGGVSLAAVDMRKPLRLARGRRLRAGRRGGGTGTAGRHSGRRAAGSSPRAPR